MSVVALILAMVLVYAIGVTTAQAIRNYEEDETTYEESYYPGQPLDMVRMSAPTWSSARDMYMIVHRSSGACWIRIQIDGRWEVWQICQGQNYVEQQTGKE